MRRGEVFTRDGVKCGTSPVCPVTGVTAATAYNHYKCRCDVCRGWHKDYDYTYKRQPKQNLLQRRCAGAANARRQGYHPPTFDPGTLLPIFQQTQECEACGAPFRGSRDKHIDHCHKTGQFRGILCQSCNTALGLLSEDPKRILSLIQYLSKVTDAVQ